MSRNPNDYVWFLLLAAMVLLVAIADYRRRTDVSKLNKRISLLIAALQRMMHTYGEISEVADQEDPSELRCATCGEKLPELPVERVQTPMGVAYFCAACWHPQIAKALDREEEDDPGGYGFGGDAWKERNLNDDA